MAKYEELRAISLLKEYTHLFNNPITVHACMYVKSFRRIHT